MPGRRAAALLSLSIGCGADLSADVCGTGAWRGGWLVIDHIELGQADAALIVGPGGRSLLVDVGETAWQRSAGAERVGAVVEGWLGCRRIDRVLLTHFHLDHTGAPGQGGLWHLVHRQGFVVGATLHRDLFAHLGADSATLDRWRGHLDGHTGGLRAQIVRAGTVIDLGGAIATVIDGAEALRAGDLGGLATAPSENDYSLGLHVRFGRFDYLAAGDLSGAFRPASGSASHDVETVVARGLPDVDVLRANHHGSNHSSNATWLGQLAPEVSIVSAGDPSPHGHPGAEALARLRAHGPVYLTSSRAGSDDVRRGGDVLVTSDGQRYLVEEQAWPARDPVRRDADGDGYFAEIDPDDHDRTVVPAPVGGCDPAAQACAAR